MQRTPGIERIVRDGEVFSLEAELPTGWIPGYRFTLEAHQPVDYEPLNWFTATHPASIFRHSLQSERLIPRLRAGLLNHKLTLRTVDGPVETRRLGSADELGRVLDEIFDVARPVAPGGLLERISKGLDATFLSPGA